MREKETNSPRKSNVEMKLRHVVLAVALKGV
jgi:hypothetical protein